MTTDTNVLVLLLVPINQFGKVVVVCCHLIREVANKIKEVKEQMLLEFELETLLDLQVVPFSALFGILFL